MSVSDPGAVANDDAEQPPPDPQGSDQPSAQLSQDPQPAVPDERSSQPADVAPGSPPRTGRAQRLRDWWGSDEPQTPRERARSRAIHRGAIAGSAFVLVGSVLTLPLLILSPGPVFNTIGEVAGQPMIEITGHATYPTEGNLDMTTVSERGGASGGIHLGEALLGWFSRGSRVVPRETIYGPGTTGEQVAQRNDQEFALSKSDAIAAAMAELGIPTEQDVVVTQVTGGSPADGIIQAGDVIVAIDGTKVSDPTDVVTAVRAHEVGDTVTVEVTRAGAGDEREKLTLSVVTAANPIAAAQDPHAAPVPYLGIAVGIAHEAPFDIDFTLENVGGPSAGMMFSLAMVDMLTPGAMTGGGHVAGTGTITPEGDVGAIGGIQQKMRGAARAGAQLFLAPVSNCADVVGHEPRGVTVVPVSTLDAARDVVQAWAADHDATFPTCEAAVGTGSSAG